MRQAGRQVQRLATRSPSRRGRAIEPVAQGSLLLVTHGVEGGPGIARPTPILARARPAAGPGRLPQGRPGLAEALAGAPSPVIVVPLLMADGFIMRLLRRRLAGRTGVMLRPPVGLDPRLAGLVRRKALAACAERRWPPKETILLLVGHGTPQHPGSAAATEHHAATVAAAGTFARSAHCLSRPAVLPGRRPAPRWTAPASPSVCSSTTARTARRRAEGLARAGVPVAYTGAIGADPAILELIASSARLRGATTGRARATSARPASGTAPRPPHARAASARSPPCP